MKRIFLSLSIVVFSFVSAQAQTLESTRKAIYESMPSCGEAVFSSPEYMAVSLVSSNTVRVFNLVEPAKRFDLSAQDQVVDVKIVGDLVYVLTQTDFEIWSIQSQKSVFMATSHPQVSSNSTFAQRASGFILRGHFAIISHGALGFSVLNLQNGTFAKVIPMPTPSNARDIATVNETTAVVAVDSDNEPNFRGIYVMDLNSYAITRQIRVDNAYVSGVRVLSQNRLMLVYFNAIWKFDLTSSLTSKVAKPNRRQPTFPGVENVNILGKVFFDDLNLYACFQVTDPKSGIHQFKPMTMAIKDLDF